MLDFSKLSLFITRTFQLPSYSFQTASPHYPFELNESTAYLAYLFDSHTLTPSLLSLFSQYVEFKFCLNFILFKYLNWVKMSQPVFLVSYPFRPCDFYENFQHINYFYFSSNFQRFLFSCSTVGSGHITVFKPLQMLLICDQNWNTSRECRGDKLYVVVHSYCLPLPYFDHLDRETIEIYSSQSCVLVSYWYFTKPLQTVIKQHRFIMS